jgi:hypothetical protein
VENEWAVFEDRIETTIRAEIGNDLFSEACRAAAAATSFDAESGVLKNYDGAISFLDYVYGKGTHIAPLEGIVKRSKASRDSVRAIQKVLHNISLKVSSSASLVRGKANGRGSLASW